MQQRLKFAHNRRVASVWCASAACACGMVCVCVTCNGICMSHRHGICMFHMPTRMVYVCVTCKHASNTCAHLASSVCIVRVCKRAPSYAQKSHISAYPSAKERYVCIIPKNASNTCAHSARSVCVVCICSARTWHAWRAWASSAVMAS